MSDEPPAHFTAVAPVQKKDTFLGGIPDNYQPPPTMQHQQVRRDNYVFDTSVPMPNQMELYKPGAELLPLQHRELIPQLQAQLVQIGLLDIKKVAPGIWGPAERAAYKKLLGEANVNGITAQEMIALKSANPTIGQQLGPSDGRGPNIVQETNPLDIIATAQEVAQKRLGRDLSEKDLEPLVKHFQAMEAGAQNKAYAMGGTKGEGGTVVTPPSVENASEDYFKKNFGEERAGYAAVERLNEFYSLLHTPSGSSQ